MVCPMRVLLAATAIILFAGNASATETTCYGEASGRQLTGKARDDFIAKCTERTKSECTLSANRLTGDEKDRSIKRCTEVYVGKPASN